MSWALLLVLVATGSTTSSSSYYRSKDWCEAAAIKITHALAGQPVTVVTACTFLGIDPDRPGVAP